MRQALAVARQELASTLRAPVVYALGAVFLLVQGLAFAGQIAALSDPRRPGPLGAVLGGYFAGSLLTWTLTVAVLALLAVRAIAEERRSGAWELLLTAPVSEASAIVGKWLAAATLAALLWVPTLAYLGVVAVWSPTGASWEWAPVACAYVGVAVAGAALLAVAMAASALSAQPLVAGAFAFAKLIGLLVIGDLPSLWPGLAADHPSVAAALDALSVRARIAELARGEVTLGAVVLFVGLAVVGLSAAIALVCRGRRRRRTVALRGAATALLTASFGLGLVLAVRHPARVDVTALGESSLDPASARVLAALTAPVTITVVRPTLAALEPVYAEVERVLGRVAEAQPRVRLVQLDPAVDTVAALAAEAGLATADLGGSGAVVVAALGRRRVIDLLELAQFGRDAIAAPTVTRLDAEAAVLSRVRELVDDWPWTVCALGLDAPAWRAVGERLRADGARLRQVDAVSADALAGCTTAVLVEPADADGAATLATSQYLRSGGAVLLASARPSAWSAVTSAFGLTIEPMLASDPGNSVGPDHAIRVVDGYGAHPVNDGFARRRATAWAAAAVVGVTAPAVALLRTSAQGSGPLAGAAERDGARVVVVGTAALTDGGAEALWATQAIRWLAHRERTPMLLADRTPPAVRLLMTPGERRAVIAACVAGVPVGFLLLGLVAVGLRRRRGRA